MRQPIRAKATARQQITSLMSYPSPVGGWNARDALASMKPADAVVLENWFPGTSYCEIRGGYASHATGLPATVKTLMVHNGMTGTNKMFGTTSGGTYEVTSAGAVGASVLARTNGKHQWTMFGDGTNNWLIACNGVDKPAYYDGTTWTAVDSGTTPALTGVTSTTLVQPLAYKGRLMFIQKDTLSVWYLSSGLAGGALTEFDMSAEFPRGGYLTAISAWTRDAGSGQDDVFVAFSSKGEVVCYQGTDPSSALAWAKIGTFFVGEPLGRRCVAQYGGDLILLNQNGVYALSDALQSATLDHKQAVSYKIENAFTEAARTYGSTFGWETTLYPAQSALIVNVPVAEDGIHHQYVMNTITKSWCQFIGWDAETFQVFNGALYFSDGTVVNKAWTGAVDGTSDIVAYGKTAFTYFEKGTQQKKISLFRPVLAVDGTLSFLTDIDVDFQDTEIAGTATYTPTTGAQWDVSLWDESYWAASLEVVKNWTSPNANIGFAVSGKVKIATGTVSVQWYSNDYVWETGGIL